MKHKHLKILIGLYFFLLPLPGSSNDSISVVIDKKIEKKIQDAINTEYVRIPRDDFDQIIESRISNGINAKINTLIGVGLGIITLLSALSIFQNSRNRQLAEKQIQAEINIAIKDAIEDIRKYYQENLEKRILELSDRMSIDIEIIKRENRESSIKIQDQIKKAEKQVSRAEEYMTNLEIEEVDKLILKSNTEYPYPETLHRTINLLGDVESQGNKEYVPRIVNLLSYIYYDKRLYNEVNQLITKYEADYKLKSNTYINAALTAIDDYHNFNTFNQRNKALEYLDKSLELTQGYGEALALKLEIYMMDIQRTESEELKNESTLNTQKIINDIINSESYAPAYETVSRLLRDSNLPSYKKFTVLLYKNFKKQFEELFDKANIGAKILKRNEFDISIFNS